MSEYLPIADHGLIGDLHSVALVGSDGTVDWYSCRRFDSPSVFASILDARRGGHYRISPQGGASTARQLYFPDTNVLITRFLTPEGVGEVEDFMPVWDTRAGGHRQRLVRRVIAVRGEMRFALEVAPRLAAWGGVLHRISVATGFGWLSALSLRALRASGSCVTSPGQGRCGR